MRKHREQPSGLRQPADEGASSASGPGHRRDADIGMRASRGQAPCYATDRATLDAKEYRARRVLFELLTSRR
jgi:hypothetical protein